MFIWFIKSWEGWVELKTHSRYSQLSEKQDKSKKRILSDKDLKLSGTFWIMITSAYIYIFIDRYVMYSITSTVQRFPNQIVPTTGLLYIVWGDNLAIVFSRKTEENKF